MKRQFFHPSLLIIFIDKLLRYVSQNFDINLVFIALQHNTLCFFLPCNKYSALNFCLWQWHHHHRCLVCFLPRESLYVKKTPTVKFMVAAGRGGAVLLVSANAPRCWKVTFVTLCAQLTRDLLATAKFFVYGRNTEMDIGCF